LIFAMSAPVAFLVRILGLLIPFLVALGLAVPYGGLHMDEWILLAVKHRLRPTTRMISLEELRGQAPDTLDELLETLPEETTAPAPGPSRAGEQPVEAVNRQEAADRPVSGPMALPGVTGAQQIYLAGTHGILRRGYLAAAPRASVPPTAPFQPPDGQAAAAPPPVRDDQKPRGAKKHV
jgi:hypothetical protein